jgi:hypothetical protein
LQFDLQRCVVSAEMQASAQPRARREPSPRARIAKLNRKCCFALQFSLVIGPILSIMPVFARPAPFRHTAAPGTTVNHPTPTTDAKLTLRVYNYSRIDPVSLARSEKVASAIFENVGVETVWMDCPVPKTHSGSYSACQSDMGPIDLVLRILPRHMAIKLAARDEPLGSAQTCSESEPACELSVFYYRVDELAVAGYRADRILGYVIAHEVAHVLLGPGHSEEGIMRGQWTRNDLQRISWGLLTDFTKDQSRQLRNAVLRRMKQPVPMCRTHNASRTTSLAWL